ncbi:hypothetical protein ACFL7D_07695 [candidate division KSB1 bacterium]
MPKNQKILLIVLVLVVAWFLYDLLGGDETTEPANTDPSGGGQTFNQTTGNQPVNPNVTSGTQTGQAAAQIAGDMVVIPQFDSIRYNPFHRNVEPKAMLLDSQQVGPLSGLIYKGRMGNKVFIFDGNSDSRYGIGERVGQLTVDQIYNDRVVLKDINGRKYSLRLGGV